MYVPHSKGFLKNAPNHDRYDYPKDIYRVTGGLGGEAILIVGSEKVALHDLGQACFSDRLISNIHEVLDPMGKTVDYILLSHTHYDHIGALPYAIKEFPNAIVCGSPVCEKVFKSETAIGVMENLGKEAAISYGKTDIEITARGLRIDRKLSEGEEIDLGDKKVISYEAKGHTDCSLAFVVVNKKTGEKILFSNESTGSYYAPRKTMAAVLKTYEETYEAAKKLKSLNADKIVAMHYGVVDSESKKTFFDDYIKTAKDEQKLIQEKIKLGLNDDQVFDEHMKIYWTEDRAADQPFTAYKTNAMVTIRKQRILLGM